MISKAEAVMAAFDVNFIPAGCCVYCREPRMNFVAAAINPRGERKGVCGKCGPAVGDTLNRIRTGYYD